jgi:hypothetical protein
MRAGWLGIVLAAAMALACSRVTESDTGTGGAADQSGGSGTGGAVGGSTLASGGAAGVPGVWTNGQWEGPVDASSPADGQVAVNSCHEGRPMPLPLCDGQDYLTLIEIAGQPCHYIVVNPPPYDPVAPMLDKEIMVGIELPSGQSFEAIPLAGWSEKDCAVLGSTHPAWLLEYKAQSVEIGFCPCSCARLSETGGIPRAVYGCGVGPLWMG